MRGELPISFYLTMKVRLTYIIDDRLLRLPLHFALPFTDLQYAELWTDAIRQVFSSLITLGALTTLASYNDFRTKKFQISK